MRLPLPPPFAGDAADGRKQGAAVAAGRRVNTAGCSAARKRTITASDSPHSQHSLQPLQLPAWLQDLLQQQERLLARIQGDPLGSYSMSAAPSSSPSPSSSSPSDAGPPATTAGSLATATHQHLPFAKMLRPPRFSNPFAALPIPGGSSSAVSAASPASASASPPSASQGEAAPPSAAAPEPAPSAAGSKALILLPRQRLLLVPAADSTPATTAEVITVVEAGSLKDPRVEPIPGPDSGSGPSAVIPGPSVVTWSKLAGWRVELPPNLPDLTKLRPDIEKLRPALEARVQHTLPSPVHRVGQGWGRPSAVGGPGEGAQAPAPASSARPPAALTPQAPLPGCWRCCISSPLMSSFSTPHPIRPATLFRVGQGRGRASQIGGPGEGVETPEAASGTRTPAAPTPQAPLAGLVVRVGGVPVVHGGQRTRHAEGVHLFMRGIVWDASEGTGVRFTRKSWSARNREQRACHDAIPRCGRVRPRDLWGLSELSAAAAARTAAGERSQHGVVRCGHHGSHGTARCHVSASWQRDQICASRRACLGIVDLPHAPLGYYQGECDCKAGGCDRKEVKMALSTTPTHRPLPRPSQLSSLSPPSLFRLYLFSLSSLSPRPDLCASLLSVALRGGVICAVDWHPGAVLGSSDLPIPLSLCSHHQTRVQASSASLSEVVRSVPSIGIQGLYRGAPPAILGQFASHGLRTGAYEASKMLLTSMLPNLTEYQIQPVASLCSTVLGTALRIPCEVLKQQLQAGLYSSTGAALKATLKEGGVKGLFRGTTATLCREVPFYVFGMLIYLQVKRVS
ncbi:unnamed protein product [Closterium sp. NIES-53]